MNNLEEIIDYEFKNKTLLEVCSTHSTYSHMYGGENNERLEFLGDSVLNYIVTDFLYSHYIKREGELSKIRAIIVSAKNLSQIIDKLNVGKFLKVFPLNLKLSDKMKCDFYESLLGAIFLDGEITSAKKFVYQTLNLSEENILNLIKENYDYRTRLQEEMQKMNYSYNFSIDSYKQENGKSFFTMSLFVNDELVATYNGESKKQVENLCAKKFLEKIGIIIC